MKWMKLVTIVEGDQKAYIHTKALSLVNLFNGIWTFYWLFNTEIWLICNYLITIITIFSMFLCIFFKIALFLFVYNHLYA